MVDNLLSKVIGWIDQLFNFGNNYSGLLVWGFVAMMVAKFLKVNLRVGVGKK